MANRTSAPIVAPGAPDSDAPRVIGYSAENWIGLNEKTPAVIVNPDASPLDQLAWCWGEVASLNAAAMVVRLGGNDLEVEDFSAIFGMRLPALAAVLTDAIHRLYGAESQRQPGTA